MGETGKNVLRVVTMLSVFVLLLYLSETPRSCTNERIEVVRDTIVDTIKFYQPVPRDSVVIRYVSVKLPVATKDTSFAEYYAQDTAQIIRDSVEVDIPITQKHYSDSAYEAWVSGYMPNLDSLRLYQRTVTERIYIKQKPHRWNVGISAGYGITPKGFQPYLGVGVTYNLLK